MWYSGATCYGQHCRFADTVSTCGDGDNRKELETTGINTRTSNLDVVRLLSSPYLNRNRKQKYITSLQIPATVKEKILKQAPGGEGGLYSASGATALMYAVARGYTDYVCELKETECGLQATGELHDLSMK